MSVVLSTFVLVMTKNPAIYAKAREEVDRVVGQERLVDFDDRESLPYIDALIKEVYRSVGFHPLRMGF